jgi:RNA-splicing ligase RtcB
MTAIVVAREGERPIKAWAANDAGEPIVPIEDQARQQLRNIAKMPFVFRHVAATPDVHWGMGATVGSVIPTEGAVIPAAVGVDGWDVLWSKGQQTVKLAENRCEDAYSAKPRLSLRNLQKLTVTDVSFGSRLQKLLLTVKTEDGREAILDGWDDYLEERFHLTEGGGVPVRPFSARFYFEDPRPAKR